MLRVGIGYDSHRFIEGRPLVLGGVTIPFDKGLIGHSDADALLHAVGDAILGAIGASDIGTQFPDTDPAYQGISSIVLLREIKRLAEHEGYRIVGVDAVVITEQPKLAPYIAEMKTNIAQVLELDRNRVGIKAKTNERMGFIGKEEGVVAMAVVTVWDRRNDGQ